MQKGIIKKAFASLSAASECALDIRERKNRVADGDTSTE